MSAIISTKNLTKYYGKSLGIKDLDLEIKEGEIFGFIGPNGAGKSTTIRTLLGLIKPTSGSATIFGRDIERDGPVIREEIGYLPSEVFYYDNMRVIDLLRYSASFYRKPRKFFRYVEGDVSTCFLLCVVVLLSIEFFDRFRDLLFHLQFLNMPIRKAIRDFDQFHLSGSFRLEPDDWRIFERTKKRTRRTAQKAPLARPYSVVLCFILNP